MQAIQKRLTQVAPLKARLKNHALYTQLHSLGELRFFMSQHVFAVETLEARLLLWEGIAQRLTVHV